jgi:hypothetical protein
MTNNIKISPTAMIMRMLIRWIKSMVRKIKRRKEQLIKPCLKEVELWLIASREILIIKKISHTEIGAAKSVYEEI